MYKNSSKITVKKVTQTLNAMVNRDNVSRIVRHTSVATLASSDDWCRMSASE